MKFTQYLFLPTLVTIVYWFLNIPILVFPKSEFLASGLYSNYIVGSVVLLVSIFVLWKLILLIVKKSYKNALAIIIGIPIAVGITFISIILLLSTSGI